MTMKIRFAGNKVVHAETKGFTIVTDVPSGPGGEVSAPSPVDLLLASLGTCTSYYVLHFCEQRGMSLDNVGLSLDVNRDEETQRIAKIRISIEVPSSFPDRYLDAVVKATSQCTVKKYLQDCPAIETVTAKAEVAAGA
jgi:putative redox protein